MKDLLILGAGNPTIIKLIESINSVKPEWNIVGFIDKNEKLHGRKISGYPIIGGHDVMKNFSGYIILNAGVTPSVRKRICRIIKNYNLKFATLVHPSVDTRYVQIGEGTIIYDNVMIGSNVSIGSCVQIEAGVYIGHDTKIGSYSLINPGAVITGRVVIEDEVLIGANATIGPRIRIRKGVVVGIGTTVITDVLEENVTILNMPRYLKLKGVRRYGEI